MDFKNGSKRKEFYVIFCWVHMRSLHPALRHNLVGLTESKK